MRTRTLAWRGYVRTFAAVGLLAGLGMLGTLDLGHAAKADRKITVVNIEYEGTKIWVPATIVVKKNENVRIKLINKVPSDPNQHGFAIAAFKVEAVVTRGEAEVVKFVADKTGLFPINCHLHPAHIGGQLLVVERGCGERPAVDTNATRSARSAVWRQSPAAAAAASPCPGPSRAFQWR